LFLTTRPLVESYPNEQQQLAISNVITNLVQTNASLTTNNFDNNTDPININNHNFDRLIVRLERNFHYLHNNVSRSEINDALIAGWERLALIRNQINLNESNEVANSLVENDTDDTTTNRHSTTTTTTNNNNNEIAVNNNLMHVEPYDDDDDDDDNELVDNQVTRRPHLPMPQIEYHDENLRELNNEIETEVNGENYFREVGNLQQIEMNNRMLIQEMPPADLPVLPPPINNINNNNLTLEDHDDFEFVDSDSEDLINEETEDEDDASQGLISLSDLHVLELDGIKMN
jgi:hypothetical protein